MDKLKGIFTFGKLRIKETTRSSLVTGGKLTAATVKERYGADFYKEIGAKGGRKSRGGGFAKDPELASRAGRLGGLKSKKRSKNVA